MKIFLSRCLFACFKQPKVKNEPEKRNKNLHQETK